MTTGYYSGGYIEGIPVWPVQLPSAFVVQAFQESEAETNLRTQMDAGPAKVRRRFSAGVVPITGEVEMESWQREILRDFYRETLQNGLLAFMWADPLTRDPVQFRFVRPIDYVPVGGMYWRARLTLEILP